MSQLEDLLGQIKTCWPQFVISKEDLLQPTPEVVFRFYSKVIEEYNKKVADLSGISTTFDFNLSDYEAEEQLFLQISRLVGKISNLKFTLGDIYQPTPIRTKNFFKVCIHFIAFIEWLQPEAESLGNEVFQTKENIAQLLLEQQQLIDEINENAKVKAELSANKHLLEQELKSTKDSYTEMRLLKASKENLYAEKRNEIENLNRELQNEEYELKCLKDKEKNLAQQRVTEKEHQSILTTIEMLENESEMLDNDDIGIGDGLDHENKVLKHAADCTTMLNKCEFNVENVKKLINKEDELKVISNTVDKLTRTELNSAKQRKVEIEQKLEAFKEKLVNLQIEHKIVKDSYNSSISQFSQELSKMKKRLQDESIIQNKIILECKRDIEKLEEDMDKMKKAFTTEYVKVSKVEKMVVDEFKNMLMKFKEME